MDFKKRYSWNGGMEQGQNAVGWKFWRRLSWRRADRHSSKLSVKPPALQEQPRDTTPSAADKGTTETSGSLPDVVDRAELRRCNSTKAPPKPPRLRLFRSPSVLQPRLPHGGIGSLGQRAPGMGSRSDVMDHGALGMGNRSDLVDHSALGMGNRSEMVDHSALGTEEVSLSRSGRLGSRYEISDTGSRLGLPDPSAPATRSACEMWGQSNMISEERRGDRHSPDSEPIYVNAAFGAALSTGLSANDRIIPPSLHPNHNSRSSRERSSECRRTTTTDNLGTFTSNTPFSHDLNGRSLDGGDPSLKEESGHSTDTLKPEQNAPPIGATLPRPHRSTPTVPPSALTSAPPSRQSSVPAYSSLPHRRRKAQRRLTSPDTRQPRLPSSRGARQRVKSARCGHAHILHSASDLLSVTLDPASLLTDLLSAGVLTALQADTLHSQEADRTLLWQSLIDILSETADHTPFDAFVEVLRRRRGGGGTADVVDVLDVMRDVDRLVHEIPHPYPDPNPTPGQEGEEAEGYQQVLAEDRVITYEVGQVGLDGVSLQPLVKLAPVRPLHTTPLRPQPLLSLASVREGGSRLSDYYYSRSASDHHRHSQSNHRGENTDSRRNSHVHSNTNHSHKNSDNHRHSLSSHSDNRQRSRTDSEDRNQHHSNNKSSRTGDVLGDTGRVMVGVCVTGHQLSGQRALALAEVLRRQQCVLELRLGKTGLADSDVAALCGALLHAPRLASLDLRLNALGHVGACAVARVLRGPGQLRRLNASSTGLDAAGCEALLSALAANTTLVDLDLSFLEVGDAVCDGVRDMLKANACLLRLRLRSTGVTAAGCGALAEGLVHNTTLQELDLSRNDLADAGLRALAGGVALSGLQALSLENCRLTGESCGPLAAITSHASSLRRLDVSVNALGDEGVEALSSGWERGTGLQCLALNMCGVTSRGLCVLLDVVERSAGLTLLKLCYNRLGRPQPGPPCDHLRYRLRIVTSSRPRLKLLLWGNSLEQE